MSDTTQAIALSLSFSGASGVLSGFSSGNDDGLMKLMSLQMEMLANISSKIDLIQKQLDLICDTLDDISKKVDELPNNVVAQLYRKDLKGLFSLIRDRTKAFTADYEINGDDALTTYAGVFKEIMPFLQVARTRLLLLEDKNTLPLVSSCMYFELSCMIVAGHPQTLIQVTLDSYKTWVSKCLDEQLNTALNDRKKVYADMLMDVALAFTYNYCIAEWDYEHTKDPKKGEDDVVNEHIRNYVVNVNKFSYKLVTVPELSDKEFIEQLVRNGIISSEEIRSTLIPDDISDTIPFEFSINSLHPPDLSPVKLKDWTMKETRGDLANAILCVESTLDKNPPKPNPRADELSANLLKAVYAILEYASLKNIALETIKVVDALKMGQGESRNADMVQYNYRAELLAGYYYAQAKQWSDFIDANEKEIADEEKRKVLRQLRDEMATLQKQGGDIVARYKALEEELQKNLPGDLLEEIGKILEPIVKEMVKAAENIVREGVIFQQNLANNIIKAHTDALEQFNRDGENIGEAISVGVTFIVDQGKSFVEMLEDAGSRLQEGKIVDAVWHFYTDAYKHLDEDAARAVQNSALLNNIASSLATAYGGPVGAAAYAAWFTYKQTNDLALALRTGIISGLTSYASGELNNTNKIPLDPGEVAKRSIATAAIGAVAIAASGGDEKAIIEGFLKGAALSVASNMYKSMTAEEIEGRAPKNPPVLKEKLNYDDKYIFMQRRDGSSWFRNVFNPSSGEYDLTTLEATTIKELGRDTAMVGIASSRFGGVQLLAETAIPMRALAQVPYMNDMAYFHDLWCDEMAKAIGRDLNDVETMITILPATVLTVAGSPTPLLTQIAELANEKK